MDEEANELGSASNPVSESAPHPDNGVPAPSTSADRLVSRLVELRAQVEVLAPPDQDRGRAAIERLQQAQERVVTLEQMLERAREREDSLTLQTVRDQAAIAVGEARIAELGSIAARVATSEAAHREEATAAAEAKRSLTLAQTEAEARQAEIERLRSRCSELEADLSWLAGEVAAATVARAEASRTERERNEARDRASAERRLAAEDRRLAAEDRRRAAEANLRATELQSRLRNAERRIVHLTNERSASGAELQELPEVLDSNRTRAAAEAPAETPAKAHQAPTEAPWTTLQRASFAASGSPAPGARTADGADSLDLTQESPGPIEPETTNGTAGLEDVPADSDASHVKGIGLFSRVLRRRQSDPETGSSQRPSA